MFFCQFYNLYTFKARTICLSRVTSEAYICVYVHAELLYKSMFCEMTRKKVFWIGFCDIRKKIHFIWNRYIIIISKNKQILFICLVNLRTLSIFHFRITSSQTWDMSLKPLFKLYTCVHTLFQLLIWPNLKECLHYLYSRDFFSSQKKSALDHCAVRNPCLFNLMKALEVSQRNLTKSWQSSHHF